MNNKTRCPVGTRVTYSEPCNSTERFSSGVVIERFHDPEQARVAWGDGTKHTHNIDDLALDRSTKVSK